MKQYIDFIHRSGLVISSAWYKIISQTMVFRCCRAFRHEFRFLLNTGAYIQNCMSDGLLWSAAWLKHRKKKYLADILARRSLVSSRFVSAYNGALQNW